MMLRVRKAVGSIIGSFFVATGMRRRKLHQYDGKDSILSVYSHYPTREANELILSWLCDEGFRFLSTDEILYWRDNGVRPQGDRLAWLTFDDGWASLKGNVMPFLEKKSIPATIFIAPNDRANKGPLLTCEDIRALAHSCPLITFENHTLTHCRCDELIATEGGANKLKREIAEASERIALWTSRQPKLMCYPYGRCNDATDEIVRQINLIPVKSSPGPSTLNTFGMCRNLYYNDMSFFENSCRVAGSWIKIRSMVAK